MLVIAYYWLDAADYAISQQISFLLIQATHRFD
jgi:hypothetical protein